MQALTSCPAWITHSTQTLVAAANKKQLHHALLITGVDGIGKREFSLWLAQALLCSERTASGACGNCLACEQILAESHPDFKSLEPEGANLEIKIDPVRTLVTWLQLTAGQSSYRVALIQDADNLNRYAANSLLKTLEEPADNAVLILCVSRAGALPATIVSRCQKITLKLDNSEAALTWLASHDVEEPQQALLAAGGGPFTVLRQLDETALNRQALLLKAWSDLFLHKGSVGRISDSLSKLESAECLAQFASWCVQAAKHAKDVPYAANPAVRLVIAQTRDRLTPQRWFALHKQLLALHRSDSASFKTQAVLEGVFADIRLQVSMG